MEVLIALWFMAVITVGMTGLAIAIIKGNAKSRDIATAVYLAQDRLEAIRNTAYADITVSNANLPGTSYSASCSASTASPETLGVFRRTTTVYCDTPVANVKRIVVTVTGTGGSITEELLVAK